MMYAKFLIALVLSVILIQADSFVWYSSSFCQYKCGGGNRPLQNRNYYKTPNGCGSYGFNFNLQIYGLNFNQCCYKHDLCYGSCNSVKQTCDEQFYSCALSECNRCGSSVKYVACKSFAKIMFRVTRTTGCTAYQRDQEMACSCSSY